jgi:hypothetical protein
MNLCKEECERMVQAFGRKCAFPAFLIDHGREFEPDAETYRGQRMRTKNCFGNAAQKMLIGDPDLIYVEGYVHVYIPVHHAWLTRPDGSIIDPTLNPTGLDGRPLPIEGYFGVPFQYDYVVEHLGKTKMYGLLHGMDKQSLDLVTGKTPAEKFLWSAP